MGLKIRPLDDGGDAFPLIGWSMADGDGEGIIESRGLSARDYFAARALASLLLVQPEAPPLATARRAVAAADALLLALAEPLPAERAADLESDAAHEAEATNGRASGPQRPPW